MEKSTKSSRLVVGLVHLFPYVRQHTQITILYHFIPSMDSSTDTQDDIWSDRRHIISGDHFDDGEDQPFDCYDPQAAQEAIRKYSPWKEKPKVQRASSPPPLPAQPQHPPRPSPPRASGSKSRPWRVDVMLKKSKGVERATVSWKQQMKERKHVFEVSGVTVDEENDGDDLFDGISTEDDELSERATIGVKSPSDIPTPRNIGGQEAVIDLTAVPEPMEAATPSFMQRLESVDVKKGASGVDLTKQSGSRNIATEICEDLEHAMQTLDDNEEEQQQPSRSLLQVLSPSSNVSGGDSPLKQKPIDYIEELAETDNNVSMLSTFSADETQIQHVEEAPIGKDDTLRLEEQQQHHSSSEPVITDLKSALEQYALPSVRRAWTDDSDDDDDAMSVGSIRSIASAHYDGEARKTETRMERNRRVLIESLEATFVQIDEEKYTITALGRADPNAKKPPPKNEYFIAYARYQRSRFVKEITQVTSLISQQHFVTVETTREEWEQHQQDIVDLNAQRDHDQMVRRTNANNYHKNRAIREPIVVETVTSVDSTSMASSSIIPPTVAAATVSSPRGPIAVETVTSIDTTASAAQPSPVKVPSGPTPTKPTVQHEPLLVNTILSVDQSEPTFLSPLSEAGAITPLHDIRIVEEVNALSNTSNTTTTPQHSQSSATKIASLQETVVADLSESVSVADTVTPTKAKEQSMDVSGSALSTAALDEISAQDAQDTPISQPQVIESSSSPPSSSENDPEPNETAAISPTPSSPKKSKASKWKDRLAKRKSAIRQQLGEPQANATDTGVAPSATSITSPPEAATSKERDPDPEPVDGTIAISAREDSPAAEDISPRRKSAKWKQRLADKKKRSSPNKEPTIPDLNDTVSATTPIKEDLPPSIETAYVPEPARQEEEKPTTTISSVPSPTSVEDEKKEDEAKGNSNAPAPAPQNDLRSSFLAFDAMMMKRQSSQGAAADADDYTEYTIEESVLPPQQQAVLATKSILNGDHTANKSMDDSLYEEITVDQSFMEVTVVASHDEHGDQSVVGGDNEGTSTPVHAATADLMTSRMFSTPQVAQEPTITLHRQTSDDDMTQLTFDQSYAGAVQEAKEVPAPIPTSIGNGPKRASGTSSAKGSTKDTINGLQRSDSSLHSSSRKLSSNNSRRSGSSRGGVSTTSSEKDSKRVAEILRKDIWSRDAKVVGDALASILTEASKGSKYRAKIIQCGGIMGIVRCMESHANVESVQLAGCKALHRMAIDANTQVIIGEMGGIATILDAMKNFPTNAPVHRAACAALGNITRHRGTTDEAEGAVPVLCASMTQHPTDTHVQSKAFGTIANLCMDNKDRLRELSDAGGMLAMTMALQQPWPSKKEKHEAISNLSILLRCLAEHEEGEDGDEEEHGYYEEHEDELDELMSVVSQLEEEMSLQPDDDYEYNDNDDYGYGDDFAQEGLGGYEQALPQVPGSQGFGQVESLQKVSRKKESQEDSNSTQPTVLVRPGKEGEDENCIIS